MLQLAQRKHAARLVLAPQDTLPTSEKGQKDTFESQEPCRQEPQKPRRPSGTGRKEGGTTKAEQTNEYGKVPVPGTLYPGDHLTFFLIIEKRNSVRGD